jgi:hypothetical protein
MSGGIIAIQVHLRSSAARMHTMGSAAQVPVRSRSRDSESAGNGGRTLTTPTACSGRSELVSVHHGWPTTDATLSASSLESGHGALSDDVSLQLSECGQHRKEELALTSRAVGTG